MDTQHRSLRSFATGPLQGVALVLYFVLLPYVIETKWRFSYGVDNGAVLRDLLVGLSLFWLTFLTLLIVYVRQLRQRRALPANGCAWLAGVILSALPFLMSSSAGATTPVPTASHRPPAAATSAVRSESPARHAPAPRPDSEVGLFALALAAKGRRDRLEAAGDGDDLDDLAQRLAEGDETLVARLRDVIGSDLDGEVVVGEDAVMVEPRYDREAVAVSFIGPRPGGFALGYAREGGTLPIDLELSREELRVRIVALHEGRVSFAADESELLRQLLRRRDERTLVVYLADPADLDEDLRELCVTLRPATGTRAASPRREVRVELLRTYPQVQGLVEDFTPTLRRRCVEMVAYLAMHPGEAVTGDRLRSRVLVHANVDASRTTLNNTASSRRRARGAAALGALLEPVSSGLYRLRGVSLDVADFHRAVARSRVASPDEAYELYVAALRLVHGEVLASVLKGFEWFTFEGHRAQLQRDGEWVARALHDAALERGDVETAFWALRQGLWLDPESEDLLDALSRVPRLRQFGGDGAGAAQHESVRTGRAVAMSWAFERFGR